MLGRESVIRGVISLILIGSMLAGCQETTTRSDKNPLNIQEESTSSLALPSEELKDPIDASVEILSEDPTVEDVLINVAGTTLQDRFLPPEGFERIEEEEGSFGRYLRELPLKAHGSKVQYYDGRTKNRDNVYLAVIDMDISDRDLQQCADAIMRLRGEYLYHMGESEKIHFNLTNGFRMDYSKWAEGYRVAVEGNETSWVKRQSASDTYEDFRAYMEFVFIYAGSLSLSLELMPVDYEEMAIGDVLIQGGTPGHAVIVVDMALNSDTGEKAYMLAQSYMPAQDIQILLNPAHNVPSPWYTLNDEREIRTPEWRFTTGDLMRFSEQ